MWNKVLEHISILNCLAELRRLTGYLPLGLVIAVLLRTFERLLQLSPLLLVLASLFVLPEADLIAWGLPLLFIGMFLVARQGQTIGFRACYIWLADYRDRLIDHLRTVPIVQINQKASANLAEPLTADINQLENALSHQLVEFLSSWLVLLFCLGLMATLALPLAVYVCLGIGLLLWLMGYMLEGFRRATQAKKQSFMQAAAEFEDLLAGILCLRTFRASSWQTERLRSRFSDLYQAAMKVEIAGAMPTLLVRFSLEAGLVLILFLTLANPVHTSPEMLICLVFLCYLVVDIAQELTTQQTMLNYGLQSGKRLAAISRYTPLPEPNKPQLPQNMGYEIHNLSYTYPGAERPQLRELSCHIASGQTTAIIGHSSAGKSTLLDLLARFDRPSKGGIRLGGCDLEQIGSQQLYQRISLVSQDVQLIDGSIRDNMLLANTDPDPTWFTTVCELSGCNLVASRFSQGLDSPVGEHGSLLSGGERQTIALARALLKDPDIVLLDEATASMDPELQQQVLRGIDKLCQGKTLIVIAHRLKTIEQADQILLLEKGRLIARGNHAELAKTNDTYRAMLDCF